METGPSPSPSPEAARAVLEQLTADADAVRYPPLPRWFFAVMAALVAGVFLAQLLAPSDARSASFAVAVVAAVLGSRYWLHRDGVSWASVEPRDVLPFLATVVGSAVACSVIAAATSASWVWLVGAAVGGAVVLRTGRAYRREFGDGR